MNILALTQINHHAKFCFHMLFIQHIPLTNKIKDFRTTSDGKLQLIMSKFGVYHLNNRFSEGSWPQALKNASARFSL